jgi:predicted TIM-barrel fold metal-dependent hydrolase
LEERLLSQVREQNAWICEAASADPRLGAVVTADPTIDAVQMLADLGDRFLRPEVKAVKIHPALSYANPDHPGYLGVYRLAEEAGVPIVTRGGSSAGAFYESGIDYCAPANFAPVLERFPRLTLVIAHLGQPFYDDLVALGHTYPNLCTDLSYVLGGRLLSSDRLASIIRDFGVERVLFGSDFPYFDADDSLDYLGDAGLSAGELELVMAGNAERILAL